MIHAYNKIFLSDAQSTLGFAFDYAVNGAGVSLDNFNNFFIASQISKSFAAGSPKYVTGMSGTELALEIFLEVNYAHEYSLYEKYERTPEYWTGWILAYYQWYTGYSFDKINKIASASDICNMYYPLHEAPEQKYIDVMNEIIASQKNTTNLQKLRKQALLTQKQLSELSGVNLRTLQEYEIGKKDINKASAETINCLSKVLCCNFYDIMEL